MAQITYRGNLSAKVFPFLASQFGRSVISAGPDQANALQSVGEAAGGDNNVPQAYYMHNVIPAAQGYRSVGYTQLLNPIGVKFERIFSTRNPDMTRGWLGLTETGAVYMFTAGNSNWTEVTSQVIGWTAGNASVAYANGYTYLCLAGFGIYKLDVVAKLLTPVNLTGVIETQIVAITSCANYLILSDGISIYWSSTIDPEDFVPSLITGAGSGKPTDLEGKVVALTPLGNGFAVYSEVNAVVATYTQNARYPWLFRGANNSKGISSLQHVTQGGEDGTNYAWTSAGLQKISNTGAITIMGEVTDFLAAGDYEVFNNATNSFFVYHSDSPFSVQLAYVAARYLVISYGTQMFSQALVYDTVLKRWGKLKVDHVACFEITLNTDSSITSTVSASAKKTMGFLTESGAVLICDFENAAVITDSVLVVGRFQLLRSRTVTMDSVDVESVGSYDSFSAVLLTTLEQKTISTPMTLNISPLGMKFRRYASRVTGINHSIAFKGKFQLNSFELAMHVNGRR